MQALEKSPREPKEEGINLIDILKVIIKRKKRILTVTTFVTVTAGVVNFLTPNTFTATSTILPIEQNSGSNLSSLLGSMGGGLTMLASQAGIGSSGVADKFLVILQTRSLRESVISKLNLMPTLFESRWDKKHQEWKRSWNQFLTNSETKAPSIQDAVQAMDKATSIKKDKKNDVISISFTAKDPILAAEVANAITQELDVYLKNNALSNVKRNRLFIEGQLNTAREEMAKFEVDLKNFQQKNKLVSLDAQTEASVKTYAELKARLLATEVEASILEKSSLNDDPRVTLKQQEIAELRNQLNKFEESSNSGPMISFQQAPTLGLNYARLKRELLVREKVFELLTQQYEIAKIDETREDISFQVLDPAIPPEKKSAPHRGINILIAFIASSGLGVFLAFVAEFWEHNKQAVLSNLE